MTSRSGFISLSIPTMIGPLCISDKESTTWGLALETFDTVSALDTSALSMFRSTVSCVDEDGSRDIGGDIGRILV